MVMALHQTSSVKDVKIFRPWVHQPSEKIKQTKKINSEDSWMMHWSKDVPWYPAIPEFNPYPSNKQRPKKFKCPHCQVGFTNNGQLKGHLRIHTGERPFKCEEDGCGKSFTRNEELTRHKRIHSGLRPYPCSSCGKTFGRKDHLKKHIKTHIPQPQPLPVPPFLFYPYVFC